MCRAPETLVRRTSSLAWNVLSGAWNVLSEFNKASCSNVAAGHKRKGRSLSDGALNMKQADARKREFSMEEVSLHNKEEDCWLVIKNMVRLSSCNSWY